MATTNRTRRFRVGPQGGYREGIYFPNGSIVTLPDTAKPEDQPSDTWIPVADKADDVDDGAFGIQERAKNPNPLPQTPATSMSFHSQGQHIPKREGEKTVGELKREAGIGRGPNLAALQDKSTDARVAAARTEAEAKRTSDAATEDAKKTHEAVASFKPPAPESLGTDEKDVHKKKH